MARAYPVIDRPDAAEPQFGEWQALRGELVALLDQVEGHYGREPTPEPEYDGLARRVRALRNQVTEAPGSARHREALRSVQKAVDRFNVRDDIDGETDELRSAIAEIRNRQIMNQQPALGRRVSDGAQMAELTTLLSGMSGRLERLEGDLRKERAGAGNVREVASQVEQMSHVVELLAGAVGETGQVKRLESQMAGLATMIENAPVPDLGAVNRRLDEVAATVSKLAELQVQQMEREVVREDRDETDAPLAAKSVQSIEAGVRSVYDRIDQIERTVGLSAGDLEKLTGEMSALTSTLQSQSATPEAILSQIDALSERFGTIDAQSGDLKGLRKDFQGLRNAVLADFEPRFDRLENEIKSLGGKIGDGAGVGVIEGQLATLMARMDETGAQLDGLARLYADSDRSTGASAADLERIEANITRSLTEAVNKLTPGAALDETKLADLVAKRTTASVIKNMPAPAVPDSAPIEAFEGRMSALINTAGRETAERLARLEATLSARAGRTPSETGAAIAESTIEPATPAPAAPMVLPNDLDAMLAALSEPGKTEAFDAKRDLMPGNPAEDRPLVDPGLQNPFSAGAPIAERRLAEMPKPAVPVSPMQPGFDTTKIERPQRPVSSLDTMADDPFAEVRSEPAQMVEDAQPSQSSQSTFIAAARRAQRAKQSANTEVNSNSIIGRALARVKPQTVSAEPVIDTKPTGKDKAAKKAATALAAMPADAGAAPIEDAKPEKKFWQRKAKPEAVVEPEAAIEVAAPPSVIDDIERESFLSRNRRPILLAAALVAVSALALNLAMQRNTGSAANAITETPAAAPDTVSATEPDAATLSAETLETAAVLTAPRVINLDPASTGSIPNSPAMSFSRASSEPMPPALGGIAEATSPAPSMPEAASTVANSPVSFELPPEALGPEPLREAAAEGDARAQFEVAAIYSEGQAVEQDLDAAAVWYERSAAQGFVPAQYRLGNLYESGTGETRDLEQARLWYQRAAEAGNRMAMHNLAAIYAGGELGEQEFESAAEWFEQAAERGMTDSQFNLGMLHARGLGVEQDFERSYVWFSLAAANGDTDAVQARDDIARSLSADVVTRLRDEVAAWAPLPIALEPNFAPIGTWSADFDPGAPIADTAIVGRVQTALVKLGFDVGTPDGMMGPKTRQAISAFERGTGMTESGDVNPRLLAVLGSQPV